MSHRGPRPKHSRRVSKAPIRAGLTLDRYPRAAGRPKRAPRLRQGLPPMRRADFGKVWNGWSHKYMPDGSGPWHIPAQTAASLRRMKEEADAAAVVAAGAHARAHGKGIR